MKRFRSIPTILRLVLVLGFATLTGTIAAGCGPDVESLAPVAVRGELDLRGWDWEGLGPAPIAGEWSATPPDAAGLIHGPFEDWPNTSPDLRDADETPTHHLRIRVDPRIERSLTVRLYGYGIVRLKVQGRGNQTFDPLLRASGSSPTLQAAQRDIVLAVDPTADGVVDLALHDHHDHGMRLTIGPSDVQQSTHDWTLARILIAVGIMVMAGLQHLALFLRRATVGEQRDFSIVALANAARTLVLSGVLFSQPRSDLFMELAKKVEIGGMYVATGATLAVYVALLEMPRYRRGAWWLRAALAGLGLASIVSSEHVGLALMPLGRVVVLLVSGSTLLATLIDTVRHPTREKWALSAATTLLATTVGLTIWSREPGRRYMDLVPLGTVVLLSVQAFLLARRTAVAHERAEVMADSLRSVNKAIARFVPTEALHLLGRREVTEVRLGDASARHLTVLFADIRGFTALSERLSAEDTFRLLNELLSRLGPHVRVHGGFVDKYIGDAIMALFPGDPEGAVRAAVDMQQELASRRSGTPLAIGIGVHTGDTMLGTIGEEQRFEATVISDAVNLASRIEGLTKQVGAPVLVSATVAAGVSTDLRRQMRRLGRVGVRGKRQAVELFEVFASDPEPLRVRKAEGREAFEAIIARIEGDDRAAGIHGLEAWCTSLPDDVPARWLLDRLLESTTDSEASSPDDGMLLRVAEK